MKNTIHEALQVIRHGQISEWKYYDTKEKPKDIKMLKVYIEKLDNVKADLLSDYKIQNADAVYDIEKIIDSAIKKISSVIKSI